MPTKSDFKTSSSFSGLKTVLLVSILVVAVGLLLRIFNLNVLPVFADESIYIRWAQVMRSESTLRFLPLSDGKQPLFMWVVMPFLKVFSDPLVAGRLVSAFSGVSTIVGIGLLSYLLFKNIKIAISSSFLWAILPFSVFFDRMALADSMLTMFSVWTFVFSFLSFKYSRLDMAMLSGFALGFAGLTKSPALIIAFLLPLLIIPSLDSINRKKLLISSGLLFTTYSIAFCMYNILRLGPEFHMIAIRNQDYLYPISEIIKHPLDPLVPHLKDCLQFFLYLTTPLGLVFSLLGLFEGGLKHWRQRLFLAIVWLSPIVIQSAMAKTITARYLLYTVPFAVILMSHAIWHIGDRTKKHFLSYISLILLSALSLIFDYQLLTSPNNAPLPQIERAGYLEQWTAGQGIKEASQIIRQAAATQSVLVGSEGFFGTPFSALQMYLNDLPQVRVIGIGQNISKIDTRLTNSLIDNQVYFVANTSRIIVPLEKLNIEVIGTYPKAISDTGTREFLIFAKVLPASEINE